MKFIVILLFSFTILPMTSQTTAAKNIFGDPLIPCCYQPMTGYFRDGLCRTIDQDRGTHVVCAVMTKGFLEYTLKCGNDLCTPNKAYNFPGLKPGDKWCLCISRWIQAEKAGKAPLVILEATEESALDYVSFEKLKRYSAK